MKNKIAVYGVGVNCNILFDYGYLDGESDYDFYDKNKAGQTYRGKIVQSLENLNSSSYDSICVTPRDNESIVNWLCQEKNIDITKIKTAHELNCEYVKKKLVERDSSVIFFDYPEADFFRYLFKDMFREKSVASMCLMRENGQWHTDKKIGGKKLFIFGGYDMVENYNNGFFEYLKDTYYESKMVLVLWDKWDGIRGFKSYVPEYITPEWIKKTFDNYITYHNEDARKYGFHYYPQFYPCAKHSDLTETISSDVLFVGNAKTPKRLELIHNIYKKLHKNGYKCRFIVIGVKEDDKLREFDIVYNNQPLKYQEIVDEIKKTKTILEICVEGDETSYRLSEAIIFNKKLIVNDSHVVNSKYYKPENIQIYETADDIDVEWLNKEMTDYEYDGQLNTNVFIEYLQNQ